MVEENHFFGQIIWSRQAPFLNRLARRGTLLASYQAATGYGRVPVTLSWLSKSARQAWASSIPSGGIVATC